MITMHLIIRKHTFTESIDSSYFGNYGKLLEIDPPTENFSELLYNFFVQMDTFKPAALAATGGPATGNTLTFVKSPNDQVLYGYSFIGATNLNDYTDNYIGLQQYPAFKAALESFYTDIGWTISDERCISVQSEFDAASVSFTNIPSTFAEVELHYNNGLLLQEYIDSL